MPAARRRPLWRCPRCGHRFVTAKLWHSCGRYRLADHFAGSEPGVRRLFDRLRRLVRACGPATMYAQKTRIVFQGDVRFAGALPRRRWLDVGLWLGRRAAHPCLRRVERPMPRDFIHHFRFTSPEQLDAAFARLVRAAYAIGRRAHLGGR